MCWLTLANFLLVTGNSWPILTGAFNKPVAVLLILTLAAIVPVQQQLPVQGHCRHCSLCGNRCCQCRCHDNSCPCIGHADTCCLVYLLPSLLPSVMLFLGSRCRGCNHNWQLLLLESWHRCCHCCCHRCCHLYYHQLIVTIFSCSSFFCLFPSLLLLLLLFLLPFYHSSIPPSMPVMSSVIVVVVIVAVACFCFCCYGRLVIWYLVGYCTCTY